MAVTNEKSDLLTNLEASPPVLNPRGSSKAALQLERFTFTQGAAAGDSTSTIRAVKLPAGARYSAANSKIRFSAFGASRVLSFGWEAYTNPHTGAAIAASLAGLGSALDVSGAGTAVLDGLTGPDDDKEFVGPVVLAFQVSGGTIPAAATVSGHIGFTLG